MAGNVIRQGGAADFFSRQTAFWHGVVRAQKAEGKQDQCGVVMEAAQERPFEVIQAEFFFHLLVALFRSSSVRARAAPPLRREVSAGRLLNAYLMVPSAASSIKSQIGSAWAQSHRGPRRGQATRAPRQSAQPSVLSFPRAR